MDCKSRERKKRAKKEDASLSGEFKCSLCQSPISHSQSPCSKCGPSVESGEVLRRLEEENSELKRQIVDETLKQAVHGGCWVIYRFPKNFQDPNPEIGGYKILKVSPALKSLLSIEPEDPESSSDKKEASWKSSFPKLKNLFSENEQSILVRSFGPVATKHGLCGMERHCLIFHQEMEPTFAFVQVKRLWKLRDVQEATELQLIPPQKLKSFPRATNKELETKSGSMSDNSPEGVALNPFL